MKYIPDSYIKDILKESKTIALVGASSNKERDSYKVMKFLLKNGYEVFPVNPNEQEGFILDQKCYPNLNSIKKKIDIVNVFRTRNAVMEVAEDAIRIKARVLWMQLDIIHEEAADLAEASGMKVVMDRCPKIELAKPYWTSKTK